MDVFIVRPFGVKEEIDFDQMERELIGPALEGIPDLTWGTTGEIFQQGNIRTDMMDRLLTADLVIADISIHNANVYYELGIRHALRHRPTVLIRSRKHDVPFDLKTDRYLAYDLNDLATGAKALRETVLATLKNDAPDSPVYQLLPQLDIREGSDYITIPRAFVEAVRYAKERRNLPGLLLLAREARVERWHLEGERLVAEALFATNQLPPALEVWNRIHEKRRTDADANLKLGTIHQRLGDLPAANLALDRVLNSDASPADRSDALAQKGRNFKDQWVASWKVVSDPKERQIVALESDLLMKSMDAYYKGFLEDLDGYYAGLNALAMTVVLIELADHHPDVFSARFEDEEDAQYALRQLRRRREELDNAVEVALAAASYRDERKTTKDAWLVASVADHRLLTSDRPAFVRQGYLDAMALVDGFNGASVARQLALYAELGIRTQVTPAALDALNVSEEQVVEAAAAETETPPPVRVILSAGHRPDLPGRKSERFPLEHEAKARAAIKAEVEREVATADGPVIGLAGLAAGSDILFHEVCIELGIKTHGALPMPKDAFIAQSLSECPGDWVERFRKIEGDVEIEVLHQDAAAWVSRADENYPYERCGMWLSMRAFAWPNAEVSVVGLWDGAPGDGGGGTAETIALARERGAKVVHIHTPSLFGLDGLPSAD